MLKSSLSLASSPSGKQRISYIDIAKGIAMLAIIAGHFGIASADRIVYTFHVPLFFLVSGYFLSTKENFFPFMKKKARQLLVPYYVTAFVILVTASIIGPTIWPEIDRVKNAISIFGAILYGAGAPHTSPFPIKQIGLLWFLWALFFSMGFIKLALKTRRPFIVVCLIAITGWLSAKAIWLPLSIQSGAMASFYMYIGLLTRKYGLLDKKPPIILVALLILFWANCIYYGVSINIVNCSLSHGLIGLALSLIAPYLILIACKYVEQYFRTAARFLNFFGQTTLIIMCFHAVSDFCFPNLMLYVWLEPYGVPHMLITILILTLNVLWPLFGVFVTLRVPIMKRLFSVKRINPLGPQKPLYWNVKGDLIPAENLVDSSSNKVRIFTYIFAAALTICCSVGFACNNGLSDIGESRFLSLVCLLVVFGATSLGISVFLKKSGLHLLFAFQQKLKNSLAFISSSGFVRFAKKHEFAMLFLIVAILWLPYLIAFFPGIFMYDSTWQLFQTQGSGALPMGRAYPSETTASFTDHKPIAHTLLIGLLFETGKAIGSQTLGIFLITLFQYVSMALAFAYLLKTCYSITNLRGIQLTGIAFLGLFPFFPMYAVTTFNDCIAAAAFTVWATMFVKTVWKKGENLTPGTILLFLLWGTVSALMKKPNVYIIIVCCIILAIAVRKKTAVIVVQGLFPAVVTLLVLPICIYPLLNVEPGDKGEMMGTLFQQTVTFAKTNSDVISDSDRATIEKMLYLNEALDAYDPNTFDWAKYYYKNTETPSELIDYMLVWVKQGLQNPLCYVSAFAHIQYPWVYPSQYIDFYSIDYNGIRDAVAQENAKITDGRTFSIEDSLNYRAPDCLENARSAITNFINQMERTPGIKLLFSVSLYAIWIPLALTLISMTSKKRSISLAALSPMYASMAVLFISPIVMSRYALPVFALIPLALAISINGVSDARNRQK